MGAVPGTEAPADAAETSLAVHADFEKAALSLAREIAPQLGEGLRICVLGGAEGSAVGGDGSALSSRTAELVKAIATELPAKVGRQACLVNGGQEGIDKLFAQHCSDASSLWNLVPAGRNSGFENGKDIRLGETNEDVHAALVLLGDLFITFEGGVTLAKQAHHAHERGKAVLPVRRTGGASSGECRFPAVLLEKPAWASEDQWSSIGSSEAPVSDSAAAVVAAVESWLLTKQASERSPTEAAPEVEVEGADADPVQAAPATKAPVEETDAKAGQDAAGESAPAASSTVVDIATPDADSGAAEAAEASKPAEVDPDSEAVDAKLDSAEIISAEPAETPFLEGVAAEFAAVEATLEAGIEKVSKPKVEEVAADFAPTEVTQEGVVEDEWEVVDPVFHEKSDTVNACMLPPAEPFQWTVDSGELPPAPTLASLEADSPAAAPKPQLPKVAASCKDPAGPSVFAGFSLAPPPRAANSVGSPAVGTRGEAVVIEELVDAKEAAPAPSSDTKDQAAPAIEANLAAVAAALAVGPPARITQDSKLKAFREGADADGHADDDEVTAIAVAAADDADVDDEACETLLGSAQDSRNHAPRGPVDGMVPLGRMHDGNDGLDSASEEEQAPPMHKGGNPLAAPKRPEAPSSPETSEQPPSGSSPLANVAASPPTGSFRVGGQGTSLAEVDLHISRSLDRFFADDHLWRQVAAELSKCPKLMASLAQVAAPSVRAQFKVQVPEPYPGIQYRKTKSLTNRYTRFAKHGTVVSGHLEDDGEWLKVTDNVYLPMRVGAVEILKQVHDQHTVGEVSSPFGNSTGGSRFGPSSAGGGRDQGSQNSRWCTGCDTADGASNAMRGGLSPEVSGPLDSNDMGEMVVPDDSALQAQGMLLGTPDGRPGSGFTVMRTMDLDGSSDMGHGHLSLDNVISGPLSHLDEASRLLSGSEPINPFTDTPRGGSPNTTPLKQRLLSDPMVPINPFSDTPPGGNSPRQTPLRTRPKSDF